MSDGLFAPHHDLFEQLASHLPEFDDGSHDLSHLQRVWHNATAIARNEGGNSKLLAAAVILHDCVSVEKNSPQRAQASRLAAARAAQILATLAWSPEDITVVSEAIAAHSFSAKIPPQSLEARILQDADRLDAIGLIGVARCFYTAGRMGSKLYHPEDPCAATREPNDTAYALDHFPIKLLRLTTHFQTPTGAQIASERHAHLQSFYDQFLLEIKTP